MTRFKHFLGGLLLGAVAMFCALRYHVVRYADGVVVVDRTVRPALSTAYADIRAWSAGEWLDYADVSAALVEDGYGNLIARTSVDNVVGTLDQTLPSLKAFSESSSPVGRHAPPPLPLAPDYGSLPEDTTVPPLQHPFESRVTVPPPIIPEITEIFVDEPVSQRRPTALPPQPIATSPEPMFRPTSSTTSLPTSIPSPQPKSNPPAASTTPARRSPLGWLNDLFDATTEDAPPPPTESARPQSGGLTTQRQHAPAPPATPVPAEAVATSPPHRFQSAAPFRRDLSAINIPVLQLEDPLAGGSNPLARRRPTAPANSVDDAPLWEVQPF